MITQKALMDRAEREGWRREIGELITGWKYQAGDDVLADALADEVLWKIESLLASQKQAIHEMVEGMKISLLDAAYQPNSNKTDLPQKYVREITTRNKALSDVQERIGGI